MCEIFLIRHGQTEWNSSGRFQGKLDSALTELGLMQARAIGERLAEIGAKIDTFVASPLGRTRQTAEIIQNCGDFPKTQFDKRLEEVSTGSWDGLTHIDIEARWSGILDGSTPFDWYFRSPDGESYDAARQRAAKWLANTNGSVIAVSHGLFSRIIRGVYLDLSKEETLELPVPQDVIWRMADGNIEVIPSRTSNRK